MDPVTIGLSALVVLLAAWGMLQWRRAADLEARLRALETRRAEQRPPEERSEPEPEPDEPEPEPEEPEPEPEPEEPEPEPEEPEPEPEEPEPAEPEPAPEPDTRRLAALAVVSEAYETCRYLDFDAIVEKPSTYRVTVPITAANAAGVRYLEDGMFSCLKRVTLERDKAILHIDTSQGPP